MWDYTETYNYKAIKKFAKYTMTDNYLYKYSVNPFTLTGYPMSLYS
jgi:hypothetical protein